MRLTLPLQLFKLPNGNIFRGKKRVVKKVTASSIVSLRKQFELEEQNMLYLRHPFLTREQSSGHAKELKKPENWLAQFRQNRNDKFAKHKYLKDQLSHLKVQEKWEFTAGSN